MRRTSLSLTALAAAACLALAGCSGSSSSSASKAAASETPVPAATAPVDCSTLTIDSDSESLPTIGGDAGAQPTVSWKQGAQAPKNLTVKTLTQGTGAEIDVGGVVKANYTGWQWDGTDPFDTSFKGGAPVAFPLDGVIQGWKCGLAGHHVGDRLVMSIPPELAYGNKAAQDAQAAQAGGAQRQQNPAGTLVFVVEIVDGSSSKVSGASATATTEGEEAVSQRGMTVNGELGQPATLSIGADAAQPTQSEVIVLARGNGPAVTESSTIMINVAGSFWDGSQPTSTWDQQAAESLNMAQAKQSLPGLIGVPEGSRVVVLIPPVQASGQQQGSPASAYVMDIEKVL
ncbi:FKBP-type peptidyl-prolyl cis-trans isomerase [Actinomyces sp. ZJ308]|uniref:FKBP-type peptidyl-prolyl cis-trans isomerase n=1 Tax=Actinomyces sp. ZJ308 TaxID=2708342 RepID=UPI001421C3F0|nr:FKBP-type peptidyl-prolyl cis-trans isomerase [Actinomyces sp. ZJ308]